MLINHMYFVFFHNKLCSLKGKTLNICSEAKPTQKSEQAGTWRIKIYMVIIIFDSLE